MHPYLHAGRRALVALSLAVLLSGCAERPGSDVLQPVAVKPARSASVRLLAVTNRVPIAADKSFGQNWAGNLSFEEYGFSVPAQRNRNADIVYPQNHRDPGRQFIVTQRRQLSGAELLDQIVHSAHYDGTIAVYVHGYNMSYQEALFRTAQLAGDANTLSPPVLFSWPSAAKVTGYVTDRDAALYSRSDLAAFLTNLSGDSRVKHIVLLGHSMGGFLSMEAARQLKLQGRSAVLAKLEIMLAAPDIDVDVFRSQLKDLGPLHTPVTLLVTKADRALSISSFLGGERPRVGLIDINDPEIQAVASAADVRLVDITAVESYDWLGHNRFASLARFGSDLAKLQRRGRTMDASTRALVFNNNGNVVTAPTTLPDTSAVASNHSK